MVTEVWASLPLEGAQDPEWFYQDPVVLLELALYGHPNW